MDGETVGRALHHTGRRRRAGATLAGGAATQHDGIQSYSTLRAIKVTDADSVDSTLIRPVLIHGLRI